MRATRAYIASAGTASVMLGAALCMLVLVSALVAFGSWPGEKAGKQIDQVLLTDVTGQKAQKVAVGTAAINANRKADARQRVAIARAERKARRNTGGDRAGTDPIAQTPGAPGSPTTAAGTPLASAPGDVSGPVNQVRQQTQNVAQNVTQGVQNTTQPVTDQVQQQVDQTTTQVNQVVDQVVGGVQQQTAPVVQPVQGAVDNTTKTVTNTVGGVLGK